MTALPAMAASSTVSAPAQLCSTYSVTRRAVCAPSPHTSSWSCTISCPGTSKSLLPLRLSQLSLIRFSPWSGLKPLGTSLALSSRIERTKRRQRRMVVYASLFGVGAPEALVIGVVALLVFGPKGLAEIARNLGKTLRAFQPTIRELQEVSREFKSTLEREIGFDEIQERNAYKPNSTEPPTSSPPTIASNEQPQTVVDPNGAPSSGRAYSSEDNLRITEEQLKLSAAQQPQQQNSQTELSGEIPSESKPQVEETAVTPPPPKSESGT